MRYTFRWLRAGSWISFFLTMACSAFASSVFGAELPPQIAWNANFDSGDTDAATAVAVGPDGNPVVTGYSGLQGRSIWRTIKYSGARGEAFWNVIFDGGG